MNQALIKVCGMRDADNIREVEGLGIDMMGFIFWPKSSRYAGERPSYLPRLCKRVGVFVDADIDDITLKCRYFGLDVIQLHGHETPAFVSRLSALRCQLIKAFPIASADDLRQAARYEGYVDYFLFDTKGKAMGGNGEKFDWDVLSGYDADTPFFLSGGIGPDDAKKVNDFRHPKCIGIDLNSRFELSPGFKDTRKLKEFINNLSF